MCRRNQRQKNYGGLLISGWLLISAAPPVLSAGGALTEGEAPPEIDVETVIKETVSVQATDGTRVGGGLYGGQQEACGVGTQAWVERLMPGGGRDWLKCHDSAPTGLCAQLGGQALFADFTSIDPTTIAASSVRGASIDEATGNIAVVGEAITTCQNGADVTMGLGGFVALFDRDGNLLADAFYGTAPTCLPPTEACCLELCSAGSGGGNEECGLHGVAMSGSRLAVAGWCESPGMAGGRQVIVASLDDQLHESWRFVNGGPSNDRALGVVLGEQGEVWATGFTQTAAGHREIFVSKHAPTTGSLQAFLMGGGALNDEGRALSFDGNGNLRLEGYVIDQANLGPLTLGGPSQGWTEFEATLDRHSLTPLVAPPAALAVGRGSFLDSQMGGPPPPPTQLNGPAFTSAACTVTIGQATGSCAEILGSNNGSLQLVQGWDPTNPEIPVIEVEISLDPAQAAFRLSSLNATIESEDCYTVTFSLIGLYGSQEHSLGSRQVCPLDAPRLTVPISQSLSQTLGFDGLFSPQPSARLKLLMRFEFNPHICLCPDTGLSCECNSPAKEASVEEVEMDTDDDF